MLVKKECIGQMAIVCSEPEIKVYIMINNKNDVIYIDSDIFLYDTAGLIYIDKGYGDRYAHAQGNYFAKPIADAYGIYTYKYENGAVREKTEEEKERERENLPKPQPGEGERLAALESAVMELLLM